MSANLIIMTKNEIYTGADSGLSVSVNGQSYRCGETNKLSYNKKKKQFYFYLEPMSWLNKYMMSTKTQMKISTH